MVGQEYVALFLSISGDGDDVVEPSSNYVRAKRCLLGGETAFPEADGPWGVITHFGIYDAPTSGKLIDWGELIAPQAVGAGDIPKLRMPA